MTVGQRLKEAIEAWPGGGVRPFQKQLRGDKTKPPKVKGSSYQMIHRYMKADRLEPPLEFVKEAAKILGVRYEWLAFGDGEMTQAAQDARAAAIASTESRVPQDWIDLIEGLVPNAERGSILEARRIALLNLAMKLEHMIGFPVTARKNVVRAAAAFLSTVDDAFEAVDSGRSKPFESWIQLIMWYDAALDLFTRRVFAPPAIRSTWISKGDVQGL